MPCPTIPAPSQGGLQTRPYHPPTPGRVRITTPPAPGKEHHPALAIPTTGQSVMVSRPPLMAPLHPLMAALYPLMVAQSAHGPLYPLMVSRSNHPIPILRPAHHERAQVGQPKQPSFRRKPESRKSPGKERAGYRGFWIPAFAGTTVSQAGTTVSRAGTTVLCCH